MKFATKPI